MGPRATSAMAEDSVSARQAAARAGRLRRPAKRKAAPGYAPAQDARDRLPPRARGGQGPEFSERAGQMSAPSETGLSNSPYPGLRPFRRDEADIFFGREEQVDQLLAKLESTRFLAVVGVSGCGKSSLVRAGMLSALAGGFMASAGPRWHVLEMRPGGHPLANLAQALLRGDTLDAEWQSRPDAEAFIRAVLRRGPLGLVELLRESLEPSRNNLLLLVDQFEEIFRFHKHGDANEATAFVDLLLESARQQDVPIFVVLTMRSDFLGDCSLFAGLPEAI